MQTIPYNIYCILIYIPEPLPLDLPQSPPDEKARLTVWRLWVAVSVLWRSGKSGQRNAAMSRTELSAEQLHSVPAPTGNLIKHAAHHNPSQPQPNYCNSLKENKLAFLHMEVSEILIYSILPDGVCLKTLTTWRRNTLSWSALLMLGFLGETSSWFHSGPRFLRVDQSEENY